MITKQNYFNKYLCTENVANWQHMYKDRLPICITFSQVRGEVRRALDGGAVPAHVAEGALARALGEFGRVHEAVHELEVPFTELQLIWHESVQQFTVMRLIPAHRAAVYR